MPPADSLVPASSRPPELRADAARNRQRVLDAARVGVKAGDLSLPMNTIANRAGVGVGTVYRHFPSHQALLEALAADAFAALVIEARTAVAEPDAAAALARLFRCALRLLDEDKTFAAVLAAPAYECPETLQLGAELAVLITEVLERARAAGLIRPEITADDLRRLICGVDYASHAGDPAEMRTELYLHVLMSGLAGPSAPVRRKAPSLRRTEHAR